MRSVAGLARAIYCKTLELWRAGNVQKPKRHVSVVPNIISMGLAIALLGGCASMPTPAQVRVPVPIAGNTGQYLSPYTSDGTIAPWVRKARAAAAGSAIGGFVGRQAGSQVLSNVPFIGGLLGDRVGSAAGRAAALALVGGEDEMRQTSDLSFRSADDLAVFLYWYSPTDSADRAEKAQVLSLTEDLYPDVQSRWEGAIKAARLRKGERQTVPAVFAGGAHQ